MTGTSAASVTVRAYVGDAKTLLAFDLSDAQAKQLAGFYFDPGDLHCVDRELFGG
jgi:hypothetical protein